MTIHQLSEAHLKAGFGVKGDGCLNYKHGGASRGAHTKEYKTWASMRRRCELPSQIGFEYYGGRGISVCPEWAHDFDAFVKYIGAAPSGKHTLDRIDPNGNYEPGNVRWATMAEQQNNRRNNVRITFKGESKTVSQWAECLGFECRTLWARIFVGKWDTERALSTPLRVVAPYQRRQHLTKE